jgi:hypothetical protein
MNEIEIGHMGVMVLQFLGAALLIGGFYLIPSKVKSVAIACLMMFAGYQVLEFILFGFLTIVK